MRLGSNDAYEVLPTRRITILTNFTGDTVIVDAHESGFIYVDDRVVETETDREAGSAFGAYGGTWEDASQYVRGSVGGLRAHVLGESPALEGAHGHVGNNHFVFWGHSGR